MSADGVIQSAFACHAHAQTFDTPYCGVSKGPSEANNDAFTPPVLVLETPNDFRDRNRVAWNETTANIGVKVCAGRHVIYASHRVNFAKAKHLPLDYEPAKPHDIGGRFVCSNSHKAARRSTGKGGKATRITGPTGLSLGPTDLNKAGPGLTDIDAFSEVGEALVGGPHSDAVVRSSATLVQSSALLPRVFAGTISARDHTASIATATRLFPNYAIFKVDLSHRMLDRDSVVKASSKQRRLKLYRRLETYNDHEDPTDEFDFEGVAKEVYDAMGADARAAAGQAYVTPFRLDAPPLPRAMFASSVDSDAFCQVALRSLGPSETGVPGQTWVSEEGGGAVDPRAIVGGAVRGNGTCAINADRCDHGAVLTSDGSVASSGPGISGTLTKGGQTRPFIIIVEPRRVAGHSVDRYVQGQILCANNGKLVSEHESVLAFAARSEALNCDVGPTPSRPPPRGCFYQAAVDTADQLRLLHYARLN